MPRSNGVSLPETLAINGRRQAVVPRRLTLESRALELPCVQLHLARAVLDGRGMATAVWGRKGKTLPGRMRRMRVVWRGSGQRQNGQIYRPCALRLMRAAPEASGQAVCRGIARRRRLLPSWRWSDRDRHPSVQQHRHRPRFGLHDECVLVARGRRSQCRIPCHRVSCSPCKLAIGVRVGARPTCKMALIGITCL